MEIFNYINKHFDLPLQNNISAGYTGWTWNYVIKFRNGSDLFEIYADNNYDTYEVLLSSNIIFDITCNAHRYYKDLPFKISLHNLLTSCNYKFLTKRKYTMQITSNKNIVTFTNNGTSVDYDINTNQLLKGKKVISTSKVFDIDENELADYILENCDTPELAAFYQISMFTYAGGRFDKYLVTTFNEYIAAESWIKAGIRIPILEDIKESLKPLADYNFNKHMLNFLRQVHTYGFLYLNLKFIESDFWRGCVDVISTTELDEKVRERLYAFLYHTANVDTLKVLTDEVYEPSLVVRKLIRYITTEKLTIQDAIRCLKDTHKMYADMNMTERFPNNLKEAHDIAAQNYKLVADAIMVANFTKRVDPTLEYTADNKSLAIVMPKTIEDVKREGNVMHHCVASYVSRIADGELQIAFVRNVKKLDEPLVTIEVKNKSIVQAKAKYNAAPSREVMQFLGEFASKRSLKLSV